MRAPLLLVLTTLAMFVGVVSSADNMPRARAARPSPRPSPKLRPSAHWPARPASPNTKRAPQHWSPPSPRPSPRPPAPSPKHHHGHGKRSVEDQDVLGGGVIIDASHEDQENEEKQGLREGPCPEPLTACRVRGALDVDAFECVDLWADLSSCGGCPADDIVHDCAAIAHARGVECVAGHCEVRLCNEGYVVAPQQDACVPVRGVNRDPTT
ncbi:hypothetical protein H4582DRAFT_833285 [Lactarius indigo]|nr:hypothetical protein H4582DRAFT_833285 [Lactarius indigo]